MKELIQRKLMVDLSYSERAASRTAEDICRFKHSDLKDGARKWLEENQCMNIEEDKYSTDRLMSTYKMTYPAALIFIDWYREDPLTASNALKMQM